MVEILRQNWPAGPHEVEDMAEHAPISGEQLYN